jgi:hypothetical protein
VNSGGEDPCGNIPMGNVTITLDYVKKHKC